MIDQAPNERSLYDFVTIKNTDSADFVIEYNLSDPINAYRKIMKPGEVLMVPRFIADHAVKHLVNQILNRMKKPTSYPLRDEITGKIVLGIQKMDMQEQFSKEQIAIKKSEELNRGSDLDKILARHKEKKPLETPNKAFVTPSG